MMNQMAADGYRVRKGWTMRGIALGIFGAALIVALMFLWIRSGNFGEMTIRMDAAEGILTTEQLDASMKEFEASVAALPHTGPDYAFEMLASNMLPFFLMSVFLVVFGEDLFSGAYRNALTYETDRTRYYLAKMAFSVLLTAAVSLFATLCYVLCGGFVFGFGAYNIGNLSRLLISTLLLLPAQIAVVAFGQFLCALFKRGGAVVAAYLVTLVFVGTVLQLATMVTGWKWLMLFDWNSVGKVLRSYWTMPAMDVVIGTCVPLVATAALTIAGSAIFQKSDLTM